MPSETAARLLLGHLADPGGAVVAWVSQLRPCGRVLLDEVERIDTTNPVPASYLEVSVALVAPLRPLHLLEGLAR